MTEIELNLKMSVKEADLVLGALANLPYIQSAGLIHKIQAQGQAQVAEAQKPPAEECEAG